MSIQCRKHKPHDKRKVVVLNNCKHIVVRMKVCWLDGTRTLFIMMFHFFGELYLSFQILRIGRVSHYDRTGEDELQQLTSCFLLSCDLRPLPT
jgi:hypothetical protein